MIKKIHILLALAAGSTVAHGALLTHFGFDDFTNNPSAAGTVAGTFSENVIDSPYRTSTSERTTLNLPAGETDAASLRFSRLTAGINGNATPDGYFDVGIDLTGYQDIQMTFAISVLSAADGVHSGLTFEYSTDGGSNFTGTGTLNGQAVYVVDEVGTTVENFRVVDTGVVASLAGESQAVFRINLGTFNETGADEALILDNIQVLGNVVPEPSTYAMIAGALALGIAMFRRRS